MYSRSLHDVLCAASLSELESAIDWLERPWEPQRNKALRARWHSARRDAGTRHALASAIESEILIMRARDLGHVARRMGFVGLEPTALDVIRLVMERLAPDSRDRAASALLAPLVAASELLTSLLVEAGKIGHSHPYSRRRRHAGR
jgi:hypothetical protein